MRIIYIRMDRSCIISVLLRQARLPVRYDRIKDPFPNDKGAWKVPDGNNLLDSPIEPGRLIKHLIVITHSSSAEAGKHDS